MEFCKLNKKFVITDYKVLELQMSFMNNDKGIAYYHADFDKFSMFDLIPSEHQDYFTVTLMRINDQIPPHTDSGIQSTINIYIETGECLTQFYQFKTNNPTTHQVANQTNGFIFNESDLEKTNAFIAKPTEAWLLDVSRPHAVIPQDKFDQRTAVAISSTLSYNVVENMLKETGYL